MSFSLHSPLEVFQDFMDTTDFWILMLYVSGFVVFFSLVLIILFLKRRKTLREYEHMVFDDELTGTKNLNHLRTHFNNIVVSFDQDVYMYYINVDNFKNYNDLLGHKLANNILNEISDRLLKLVAPHETVYRVHSDHFIVLYPSATDLKGHFSKQLLSVLKEPYTTSVHTVKLTVSIGRYHIAEKNPRFNECLLRSELALQEAKVQGKDQVAHYSRAIKRQNSEAFSIFRLIKDALKDQNFFIEFQPIIETASLKIVGLETLIRINHSGKSISPQMIINYAEKYHMITEIDRFVVKESFSALKRFVNNKCPIQFMSVNISTQEIRDETFITYLTEQAKALEIDPEMVTIEFTETYRPEDFIKESDFVRKLKTHGFKVAIDDFGSGYSSMIRLSENELDKLKIDRSLITGINAHAGNQRIVEAIVGLAEKFGLDVIAEGVETKEELNFINTLGVKYIQGFYFYPAMSEEDFLKTCKKNAPKKA